MLRRSIIIVAVLVGAIAGTVIALQSPRVARNVQEYLTRLAYETSGVRIHMESFALELAPPGFTAEQITAYLPNRSEPWLSVRRGHVRLQPWPSPAGALVIDHLELDGLRGEIQVAEALARAPKASAAGTQAIDVVTLLLWNTDLVIDTGRERVTLRRADIAMQPARRGGRDVNMTVGEMVIDRDGRRLALEATLRGRLHGSIDRPQSFVVERAFFDADGAGLGVSGTVGLGERIELDLTAEAHAPLARIREWVTSLPALDGQARARVQVEGPTADPRSKVQLQLSDLRDARRALGDLEIDATHAGRRIQVASLRYQHRGAGSITGSGSLEVAPGLPVDFNLRLHGVSLPGLLDLTGLPDAHVRGAIQGDVHLTGKLRPLALQAQLDSEVTGFEALNAGYRETTAFSSLALGPTTLRGAALVGARAVTLNGMHIQRGASLFSVEGTLSYDAALGLDLRAFGEDVDLAEMGAIASVPFAGRGTVAGSVEGPYNDPTISGAVDLRSLVTYGYLVGDTKATLIYRRLRLEADRITVRRASGTISGVAALDFSDGLATSEGAFSIEDVDARDLFVSAGLPAAVAQRFRARLRGDVRLAGPIVAPRGSLALRAPELRIDDQSLGELRLSGTFGGEAERVAVKVTVEPAENATIETSITLLAGGDIDLAANAKGVPIEALRPLMGGVPVAGSLTGTMYLAGPAAALSGEIVATVSDFVAYGLRLEATRLHAAVSGGQASITGSVLGGEVPLTATLTMDRALDHTARLTFNKLDVRRMIDLPHEVAATTRGQVTSKGSLSDPTSLKMTIDLDRFEAAYQAMRFTTAEPAHIHYGLGVYHIGPLLFTGAGAQLKVTGDMATSGALSLHAVGAGDLRVLNGMSSKIEWLGGRYELDARVQGRLDAPLTDGRIKVADGALRVVSTSQVVSDVQARVALTGRAMTLESGSATVGGGTANLSGQIILAAGARPEIDVRADLKAVSIRPYPDLQMTVGGGLMLTGPTGDLELKGNLKVDSLRYTANLDLPRLIPQRRAPPLMVPAFEPGQSIHLNVRVQAPGNLIVSGNVIDAEFRADLMVTGTNERLGLLGSLTPLRAKARYRDNVFTVERASIDFTEEFRIFTQFDIRATSEACGMRVAVDVHGDSDRYNVTPTGQDENGPVQQQDVFSCLQFGLRTAELERLRDNAAGRTAGKPAGEGFLEDPVVQSSLDTLWTVTGVDAQVRKMLPVDEVRLTSGYSPISKRPTLRAVVGKELTEKLSLKYSRALTPVELPSRDIVYDQQLSLEYEISNIATLQGSWMNVSDVPVVDLGLDLELRWEFR